MATRATQPSEADRQLLQERLQGRPEGVDARARVRDEPLEQVVAADGDQGHGRFARRWRQPARLDRAA